MQAHKPGLAASRDTAKQGTAKPGKAAKTGKGAKPGGGQGAKVRAGSGKAKRAKPDESDDAEEGSSDEEVRYGLQRQTAVTAANAERQS